MSQNKATYGAALTVVDARVVLWKSTLSNNDASIAGDVVSGCLLQLLHVFVVPIVAVYYISCTLTISVITGGAMMLSGAAAHTDVQHTMFFNNSARSHVGGGAVYAQSSTSQFSHCSFIRNSAPEGTGGSLMFYSPAVPTIVACILSQNGAKVSGGALWFQGPSYAIVSNTKFDKNYVIETSVGGGAIAVFYDHTLRVENSTFTNHQGSTGISISLS